MAEKRNFSLLNEAGEEVGIYSGAQPRDAALKVANTGVTDIVLREKGTKKLHYFKGKRTLTPCPPNAPDWMKKAADKNSGKIWKANVEKIGTANMEYHEATRNDAILFKVPKAKV